MHQEIQLTREVTAIQIPSGEEILLPAGLRVMITQALGGTYTVATDQGFARIRSTDVDALGLDEKGEPAEKEVVTAEGDLEAAVWNQLKSVYDPEIPVDIVNLGLVYDCSLQTVEDKTFVTVKMTLTAPGCGMGPTIAADARNKILSIEGIHEANVDLVWDPPWNPDMISEEGQMKLGRI